MKQPALAQPEPRRTKRGKLKLPDVFPAILLTIARRFVSYAARPGVPSSFQVLNIALFQAFLVEENSISMNNKIKPALIGGAAIGLLLVLTTLVAVLPIPLLGCCKCLWPIAGGVLATMLYVKDSPTPVTILDGVIVGALAGLIGALIHAIIGLPITYFMVGVEAMELQARRFNSDFPLSGMAIFALSSIVGFVVFIVLSSIGGLLGVPIFERRKSAADAPDAPLPGPDAGPAAPPGAAGE